VSVLVAPLSSASHRPRPGIFDGRRIMPGKKKSPEPMKNQVEMAIRAYDPCLSCATHALGQMPLDIKLVDSKGDVLDHYKS